MPWKELAGLLPAAAAPGAGWGLTSMSECYNPSMSLHWPGILVRGAEIVAEYQGGVTLRQLFYRLLSEQLIPNTRSAYQVLSDRTAAARRAGRFPRLIDQTRAIGEHPSWEGPAAALSALTRQYRRPRTEYQECALYLGAEKATMAALLEQWFGELGIPVILLRGYTSQSYIESIVDHAEADGRQPVLIYAGDLDPSGEDIERDFTQRAGSDWTVRRVAVTLEQIDRLGLVKLPGKKKDTRAEQFVGKYGRLFQVEIEAIEPNTLQDLYSQVLFNYWDDEPYQAVLEQEGLDRIQLAGLTKYLD